MANTLNWSKWVKMGCNYEIAMCAKKDEVDATLLLKTVDEGPENILKELVFKGKTVTDEDDSYYWYVKRDYSSYMHQPDISNYLKTLSKSIPSFEAVHTNDEGDSEVYRGVKSQNALEFYPETTFSFYFNGIAEEDIK